MVAAPISEAQPDAAPGDEDESDETAEGAGGDAEPVDADDLHLAEEDEPATLPEPAPPTGESQIAS